MPTKRKAPSPPLLEEPPLKKLTSPPLLEEPPLKNSTFPFLLKVNKLGGRVLGSYLNSSTPVTCCCPKGHVFPLLPITLLRNNRWCVQCKRSKGEELIEKTLRELGLTYHFNYHISSDLSYPFYFETKGKKFLIVYNSLEETPLRDVEDIPLRKRTRKEEKDKINLALQLNYKVILLDKNRVKFAKEYISASITGATFTRS